MALGVPIIGDIIDAVKDLASEVIVDKDKKREVEAELEKLRDVGNQRVHEEVMAQIALNTEESKHGSVFVAGWRPFIGWVCGAALAAQVIIYPLLAAIFSWSFDVDTELLILTMSGMLGIGAMRTYEKVKGVSTNDFTDVPARPKGEPENILPPLYASQPLPEEAPWTK